MKKALLSYAEKAKNNPGYCTELIIPNERIRQLFEKRQFFSERKSSTSLDLFEKEFGYKLPDDVVDLINLFWHTEIYGYYKITECIILFSCHNHLTESDSDILLQKGGIIELARSWRADYKGDINHFLPIGWTGYSGRYILYELNSGRIFEEDLDNDGSPVREPFAGSLKELIQNLTFDLKHNGEDKT